jgi:hypothetical protein
MRKPLGQPTDFASRFVERVTIRRLGVVEYVSCRLKDTTERALLVSACAECPRAEAAPLLAEIARVHRLLDHPLVPPVLAVDDEAMPSHVAFACDAVVDLETLIATAAQLRHPVDIAGGSAFAIECLELLEAIHRVIDPATNAPVCLGAIATVNFLISEQGRLWVMGWGHPYRGALRTKLLADVPLTHVAPETVFGAAPLPGSDLGAITPFFHSFSRLGDLPPEVVACLSGAAAPDSRLTELVAALMANAHAPRPEQRSVAAFLADFRPSLDLLGIVPDRERAAKDRRAVLEAWRARAGGADALVVGRDARWCKLPEGLLISLQRRGAMRRLMLALAEARRDTPGHAITWQELLRAGWPSESPRLDAAKNRVYVAVAQLRSMGLRDVLMSDDTGYFLDPSVPLSWSDAAAPAS